jgi:hypothetical protein
MTRSITKTVRSTSIITQTLEYQVPEDSWQALLDEGLSEEEALDELRSNNGASYLGDGVEVHETLMEHDVQIES